ncbi:FAD/NAD(P)-binding domain-containing protein [Sistotremastrum suecicum HHB10207 ss-3]|uniref:FAD/NAD(P)-binding domain-containing protein n=1 Tax=Sistotremastrum suecicum HHB10207 ss-3 TaxID=1314776 RepID=A0A166FGQ8_9AGAM|nr:FAD/NAD(P)-binding domain-containing protein [Sistotremastrum suecicum HHB10207 ss-3]
MSVWPRTVSVFRKWGFEDSFRGIVTQSPVPDLAWEMRKSDQREGVLFHVWKLAGGLHSFHRAHLLSLLSSLLPRSCYTFSSPLKSYTQSPSSNSVTLHFENAPSQTFDALIAADGLWSPVRTQMYKELSSTGFTSTSTGPSKAGGEGKVDCLPKWTGTTVFRALIPLKNLAEFDPSHRALRAPQMYCGHNKRVLTYPMNRGETINFVLFLSSPSKEGTSYEQHWAWQKESDVSKAYLGELLGGWEEEVQVLVRMIPDRLGPPGPTRWPLYALNPLPEYTNGRVALLGDAAHATTPHFGFGACSSIEDALTLSTLLLDPRTTSQTLPLALDVYGKVRCEEGRRIIEGSREVGFLYEFSAAGIRRGPDGPDGSSSRSPGSPESPVSPLSSSSSGGQSGGGEGRGEREEGEVDLKRVSELIGIKTRWIGEGDVWGDVESALRVYGERLATIG